MKKGQNMGEKYRKVNKEFQPEKTSKELTKKYSRYPFVIKGIVFLLSEYLTGASETKKFADNYLERTPVLLKRIEYSKDKEQFNKIYSQEIKLLKSLNSSCDSYKQGKINKETFDSLVEYHSQSLSDTETITNHIFSA